MTLKWSLVTRHMRPHEQLQAKMAQKIGKLEKHIEHFPADAVHLQVQLERHVRKLDFEVALTLRLPAGVLRSQKRGDDPVAALDQAVKVLLREVGMLKSSLRRENQWNRRAGLPRPQMFWEYPGGLSRAMAAP